MKCGWEGYTILVDMRTHVATLKFVSLGRDAMH